MADTKISGLTALTGANTASGDLLTIVDVSDTTMAATGTNKKITLTELQSAPVSGGTANGVLYLNGSKVATSGSALVFDGTSLGVGTASPAVQLHLNKTSGTSEVRVQSGSAFGYMSLDSSGNYFGTGTAIPTIFTYNNAEQMRLTSTGLGIGTSSPGTRLHVKGATNQVSIKLENPQARTFQILSNGSTGGGGAPTGSFAIYDETAGADRLTLDASGNLGIGTGSPGAKLDVVSTASVVGRFATNQTNTDVYLTASGTTDGYTRLRATGGDMVFITGLNERMRIDSSGNLGLGVTPSAWGNGRVALDVKSNGAVYSGTNMVGLSGNAYDDGSWKRKAAAGATLYEASSQHAWYITGSSTAGSTISWTQAMTLDADGDLGIGTTSPVGLGSSIATIDIANTNGGGIRFRTSGAGNSAYLLANSSGVDLFTGDAVYMRFGTSGTERARIDSSGNLLVGATSVFNSAKFGLLFDAGVSNGIVAKLVNNTSGAGYAFFIDNSGNVCGSITRVTTTSAVTYNTTSDYRLKTVIGPVANAGQRIDSLKPVEYTWNVDGSRTRGFLAHQFQEVYAGSVTGTKDAVDANNNPVYQSMQASSSEVIADIVAELQSLRKRLADAGIA